MLSYCQVGKAYPVKTLSKTQKQLIIAFHECGIIYLEKSNTSVFYPTYAVINLIFKMGLNQSSSQDHEDLSDNQIISLNKKNDLRIIVETNLQVVGYVSSELHISLLSLFCEIHIRMPNMVIGSITRDKAKTAFRVGINVAQIVDFLSSHAHEVLTTSLSSSDGKPQHKLPIPSNVVDQLILWEQEDHRIRDVEAEVVSFDQNQVSLAAFHEYVNYMKRLNACIWFSDTSLQLAVTPNGFESLKHFLVSHSHGEYL